MCDHSMKQTPCNRAQSSGLRFLAVGFLPLPQLRSFCQGDDTLVHFGHELYPLRYLFWCSDHSPSSEHESVTLGGVARLSHAKKDFVFIGTGRLAVLNLAHQLSMVCIADPFTREPCRAS